MIGQSARPGHAGANIPRCAYTVGRVRDLYENAQKRTETSENTRKPAKTHENIRKARKRVHLRFLTSKSLNLFMFGADSVVNESAFHAGAILLQKVNFLTSVLLPNCMDVANSSRCKCCKESATSTRLSVSDANTPSRSGMSSVFVLYGCFRSFSCVFARFRAFL